MVLVRLTSDAGTIPSYQSILGSKIKNGEAKYDWIFLNTYTSLANNLSGSGTEVKFSNFLVKVMVPPQNTDVI